MFRHLKVFFVLGAVVFVVYLIYSSSQQGKFKYKVCIDFHGQNRCAIAAGQTPNDAIRSAQGINCSALASGRDEQMACEDTTPSSVEQISEK